MVEFPYLPQLYSVLKAQLDVRGLSDVFRGGIGSYSLFMMIVASLKHKSHPPNNASGALMHFLRFWSQFRTEEHSVSIEPVEFFAKSEQLVMHEKALSHIEVSAQLS
jgi:non-canonical poly(A) RNA polymerase PAPD5/7